MVSKKTAKKATKKAGSSRKNQNSVATKASKKAAGKRSSKASKKVSLEKIPAEKYFVLKNGKQLNHYLALADTLDNLEKEVVEYHVNELRNDFATWVEDVFGEKDLAKKIAKSKSPDQIRMIIYKHLIDKHVKA
ncbi:MAG: hypothetical protein ACLFTH_02525 [Candidatus Woesearchaeota archaeon]